MFDIHNFIKESNLIDPQYNELGVLIKGQQPGDQMYDNQVKVFDLMPYICDAFKNNERINPATMIHRELTRGISIYEDRGDSGQYRRCGVYIGGESLPAPIIAQTVIEEVLNNKIMEVAQTKTFTKKDAYQFAWWCHHVFECAHPFIDGNGRTGRLLLNTVLLMLGQEMLVIKYSDRFNYYSKIQEFRRTDFPSILASLGG